MAGDKNSRYRARALWLLAQLETKRESAITQAANDPDENIRCQSIRMARQQPESVRKAIRQWTPNATPAVNRERAIALREYQGTDFAELWTNLAVDYDGKDRWYLEALGIAADGRWNECIKRWLDRVGKDWNSEAGINLIWRSRADNTPALIADLLAQPQLDSVTALRLFRSLDFQNPDKRNEALRALAAKFETREQNYQPPAPQLLLELAYRIPGFDQLDSPSLRSSLVDYANESLGEAEFVEAASRLRLKEFSPRLLSTVLKTGDRNRAASATRSLIAIGEQDRLSQHLSEAPEADQLKIVNGWNWSGASEARQNLQGVVENKALSLLVRSEAIKALGQWPEGQKFVLQQVSTGELETDLRFPAANILLTSNDESIRVEAQKYVSLPSSADNRPLPTLANLLRQRGDVNRGADVFANIGTCAKCHKVNGSGNEVGPDLSEVGGKLSVEALYESILNPSAGISHSYEMYTAALADGRLLSGVLVSKTADEVVLKDKDAVVQRVPMSELDEIKQQKKSLMPDDLQKLLTEQQLVDVVEYMKSLKKK